jgi:hypothetical protein
LPANIPWKTSSEIHSATREPAFEPLQVRGFQNVLPGGLHRGGITEIYGKRSSGRLSLCLHILAEATRRGEICAVVDLNDSFHAASAAAAEVRLEKNVWVRCRGNAEHAMRAADLLLHAGGFGVVLLDLSEAPARTLNRIPLSYWYRFRRAVANSATILLLCADTSQARSCALHKIETRQKAFRWSGKLPALLLRGLEAYATQEKVAVIRPESLFLHTAA